MSRRRRVGAAGQAMVELAILAPLLIALTTGATQVGSIAYSDVTVDTAAREGARIASEAPNKSLDFVPTLNLTSYTCGGATQDALTEASVCEAVRGASGLISGSSLTITVSVSGNISARPRHLILAANPCPAGALASGVVSGLPTGTVATMASPSKSSSGAVTTDSSGNYSMCLSGSGATSITATAVDASGCVYSTSLSVSIAGKVVTPTPGSMTLPASGVCPTPAPTPVPTATPTPTPVPTNGPVPTPPPSRACSTVVSDTSYVQVAVTYHVLIFVPFVNRFFEDSPGAGTKTVTATQRMQLEPCAITQGA